MNASISENINFNESLVSFAKPNNMFQSFAFSRSKNQNSNVRSSNSLLNNLSNNKLVRLAMPSRLESSNLFHKFKNHLYQNDENSYSQIMEISNNNFAIEKINSELFSNNAFKPFVSNQDKALISDLTYDIPSAIRNENTSNINSVPIFINCVKEGWKDRDKNIEYLKYRNASSLALPVNQNSFKLDSLKNVKINEEILYKRKIEEDKEPQNNIVNKKKRLSSNGSISESDSDENQEEIKDKVNLELPTIGKRRASRIVTYNMPTDGQLDISMNNLRLKSNLLNHASASEELIRVWNMANMFKNSENSKEENSHFSKLSSTQKQINYMIPEVSKISSMLTPIWGWASILIVDDQIINRYNFYNNVHRFILNEFGMRHRIRSDEAENGKIGILFNYWAKSYNLAYQMYIKQLKSTCCSGYRLILMDLNMPVSLTTILLQVMNGIKSSQKILETETSTPKPMIVAVTGFTSDEEREKWFKVGISGKKLLKSLFNPD